MNYTFGRNLKERPEDIEAFKNGIEYWKAELDNLGVGLDKVRLLSKIGVHLRILGHLEESLKYLYKAKRLFESESLNASFVVNEIRIAQTLQFLKRFDEATKLYNEVENLVETETQFTNLLHFVYQHKGKNYFDQQQYHLAKKYIEKALTIRLQLQDENLIASSTFTLKIINEKLKSK